jgi:hypothetical protein
VAGGQLFEQLDVAMVSPFIFEKHVLAGVLLSRWIAPGSVAFEDFSHKFSTCDSETLPGKGRVSVDLSWGFT